MDQTVFQIEEPYFQDYSSLSDSPSTAARRQSQAKTLHQISPDIEFYGEHDLELDTSFTRPGGVPHLVKDLLAATSAEERQRLVLGMLHAIGFEWLSYGTVMHLSSEIIPRSFFTTYAHANWTEEYFRERYYELDERHRDAPCPGMPLVWDIEDLNRASLARRPNSRVTRFHNAMAAHGIRSGVFFVLASPRHQNERTVISLTSATANRRWIVDSVIGQALTLGLSMHELMTRHSRVTAIEQPGKTKLSTLQQDILECLVHGLSDKQIAHKLNLNSHNVDYHLRQLRRRFSARNRVQLVSAAIASNMPT